MLCWQKPSLSVFLFVFPTRSDLVESHHPKHIAQAEILLDYILKARRDINAKEHPHEFVPGSFRIGIAGPPGAGKSTFIEAFGTMLCKKGLKVAVLAIGMI